MINDGDELRSHVGHKIECVSYGIDDEEGGELWAVSIECVDCNEPLLEFQFGDDDIESGFEEEVNFKGLPLVCVECDWSGEWNEIVPLSKVPGLGMRLKPGSSVPHGGCPNCGALVYPAWRAR